MVLVAPRALCLSALDSLRLGSGLCARAWPTSPSAPAPHLTPHPHRASPGTKTRFDFCARTAAHLPHTLVWNSPRSPAPSLTLYGAGLTA